MVDMAGETSLGEKPQSRRWPSAAPLDCRRDWYEWKDAVCPKPPVELAILMVALAVRSKASRQASAGGHLSIKSEKTDVAANIVKSTSSML